MSHFTSQHSFVKNIQAFLHALTLSFGYDEAILFANNDLYELDNFKKVRFDLLVPVHIKNPLFNLLRTSPLFNLLRTSPLFNHLLFQLFNPLLFPLFNPLLFPLFNPLLFPLFNPLLFQLFNPLLFQLFNPLLFPLFNPLLLVHLFKSRVCS